MRLIRRIRLRPIYPRISRRLRSPLAFLPIALAAAFAAEPVSNVARTAPPAADARPANVLNPRVTGAPFHSVWDSDDYGGAPGIYHVVQHPQTGFIYAGNTFGLIEYDGAAWRLIPFRDESVVPIIVIDRRGTVWMGGINEVAVLQPDARGELQPVEITDRLPVAERNFGRLYLGLAAPNGVYLASPSHLVFFGHDGTARSWPAGANNFNGLGWIDDTLHASKGAAGLVRMESGGFIPIAPAPRSPNPALSDTLRLFAAQAEPGGGGGVLLTNVGPLRWAGRGAPLEPLSAAVAAEFARESATTAAFLPDGRLAFSFPQRGLVILEPDGQISMRLDPAQGFSRGQIDHLATDDQGGLWLARVNSLVRLQIDSRFATQGAFDGARAFQRQGERLYVSHQGGVSWRDDATGRAHPVTGLPTSPSTLFGVGERIYGTGQFLREITREDRAVDALRLPFNQVTPLRASPGRFVGASVAGLRLLRFDGTTWQDEGLVASVRGSVRAAHEDREGYLWAAGYAGSGSWRVDFRAGPSVTAAADFFDDTRGLPFVRGRDVGRFLPLGGETLAVRSGSLLRYDRAAGRFVREDRIENAPAVDQVAIAPAVGEDQWWFNVVPAPQLVHLVPTQENRWRAEVLPLGPLQGFVPIALHYDPPTRTIWLGNRAGPPISVDPDWRSTQPLAPLRATVRRFTTAAGELLWADSGSESTDARPLTLDPKQNSVRFNFTAPAFRPDHRGAARTVYRTRLDGFEDDWSAWSITPWREFSQLPYRDFVFRVQARDLEGRESSVGTLAFAITPPWWRAGWFLALGSIMGIGAMVGAGRWLATRALRRRVQLLEAHSAVERERLRLARDLHDEVGSGLGRVILFADEAERAKQEPEKVSAAVAQVRSSALELVQHARQIVWAVNPQHDTLASVIDRFAHYTGDTLRAAGIACDVQRPAAEKIPPIVLGSEARHSLFLALKEAVHNCVKYSEAKTAEFRLEISGNDFVVTLRDHGRGFAQGEVRGTGYGTVSIVARANVLGGKAEITSEVGRGTTVMLRVPLNGPAK